MRSALRRFVAASIVLAACSSSTAPQLEADPSLSFDAARARWAAAHPASYTFELDARNAWGTSPGWRVATVVDGVLTEVRLVSTGERLGLDYGYTIDELWNRLATARSAGEAVSQLEFSAEGIPISAMVGTFANDGGVEYVVRTFETLGR
jgi:hypothetical protein